MFFLGDNMTIKQRAKEISKLLQSLVDDAEAAGETFTVSFDARMPNHYFGDWDDGHEGKEKVGFSASVDYNFQENDPGEEDEVEIFTVTPSFGWYSSSIGC